MRRRVVIPTASVEILDHDHGHWCNTCHRATGIRFQVAATCRGSLGVTIGWACGAADCGGVDITPADDDVHHC